VTANLTTNNDYSATASIKDLFAKGTKFSTTGNAGEKGLSYKEAVSFKNDVAATKASVSYAVDKPIVIDGYRFLFFNSKMCVMCLFIAPLLLPMRRSSLVVPRVLSLALAATRPPFSSGAPSSASTTLTSRPTSSRTPCPTLHKPLRVLTRIFFSNETGKSLVFGAGWFQKVTSALKVAVSASADGRQITGPAAALATEYKVRSPLLLHPHSFSYLC